MINDLKVFDIVCPIHTFNNVTKNSIGYVVSQWASSSYIFNIYFFDTEELRQFHYDNLIKIN